MTSRYRAALVLLTTACFAGPAPTQTGHEAMSRLGRATQLVIPLSRSFAVDRNAASEVIAIESVVVRARILDQTASTSVEIVLHNRSGRPQEAILLMPVPEDCAIRSFLFEGSSREATAQVLPRDQARRLYTEIVDKVRDPALLEFAGSNLLRSSVFPVAAGGKQRILLTYEHLLPAEGGRIDYVLPRSESLDRTAEWSISVRIHATRPISTVYSPSHQVAIDRRSPKQFTASLVGASAQDPGPFRLSFMLEHGDKVTASMFTYPDPSVGGGYFLLLAGLPPIEDAKRCTMKREVTVVLDRSGSMAGAKMDQAKAAALQVIEGLEDGEGFNIVDYSTSVASFSAKPVRKDRQTLERARVYLEGLKPGGGTNIYDALVEALRPEPLPGTLPLTLFLTDGLPTVGQTAELGIGDMVAKGNPHKRRIFTFGVGHDVNVPLLDRIAEITRARTSYVLPGDDVEVEVARVFERLYGPVLADAKLATVDENGEVDTQRVREMHPAQIPDLFLNDQLVVLGQYRGDEPIRFELSGNFLGAEREFKLEFDLAAATTRNAFVPRLWASRRIAYLIDQVRQAGAQLSAAPRTASADPFQDPRMRELRDEILRLSTRFGILSEYTAFLATEGTRLSDWHSVVRTCETELDSKALRTRTGIGAINQGANIAQQKAQGWLNARNTYWDQNMNRVEVTGVQQVSDRAFFRRGKRWIDGRAILKGDFTEQERIPYGSDEHKKLLRELIRQGRSGILSLDGEILIRIDGKNILVINGC